MRSTDSLMAFSRRAGAGCWLESGALTDAPFGRCTLLLGTQSSMHFIAAKQHGMTKLLYETMDAAAAA
jgi:hypothetical protein